MESIVNVVSISFLSNEFNYLNREILSVETGFKLELQNLNSKPVY